MRAFTAYIEWDPETKLYVGMVPGISGAHAQGATLDELHENLKEVLKLCLEEYEGRRIGIDRSRRHQLLCRLHGGIGYGHL